MPRKEPAPGHISAQAQQDLVSEGMENFELPKSLVTRIARSALPENVKMQKETVLSLIKGSTIFINYLGAAHDVALSKQHKSISAADVLKALEIIEFGDLVDKLQGELQVYRDLAKTDKTKKGSSSIVAPKGKAPSATSVKGKEKAIIVLPPALGAAPLGVDVGESISSGPGAAMDVDEELDVDAEVEIEADAFVQVDTDGEGTGEAERLEEEEEEPEEPEELDELDEEPGELVDTVVLDKEDLRRDSRGPEESLADAMED
ncbi:histone-fold-containing protein [Mycena maculata]|uniref:DNA polymerase epsilon subunit D n=1 Tax=Mycena maculata TaxID=230809 RepID=A0AAD7JX45_9AGAR|nr:histone-fold-containing protein [Mycena maculata]